MGGFSLIQPVTQLENIVSQHLSIRLDDRMHLSLKEAAKKVRMDMSELVRQLLFIGLVSLDSTVTGKVVFRDRPMRYWT